MRPLASPAPNRISKTPLYTGKPIPVYGDGQNVRDWLFVTDHCEAIRSVLARGKSGETYNIGGRNEVKNLDVVNSICSALDELRPNDPVMPHAKLITFVTDRPGHDRRYSLSSDKVRGLGWRPQMRFDQGLQETVRWYRDNSWWWEPIRSGEYRAYYERQYGRSLS